MDIPVKIALVVLMQFTTVHRIVLSTLFQNLSTMSSLTR